MNNEDLKKIKDKRVIIINELLDVLWKIEERHEYLDNNSFMKTEQLFKKIINFLQMIRSFIMQCEEIEEKYFEDENE
jgi:hypothetical protein